MIKAKAKAKAKAKKKEFHYKNETVDFLYKIISLKSKVIQEMEKEINNLRDLVTRRR